MDASCNNTYNEKNNAINSPNYPRSYPNDKYCNWNVTAPIGYKISVERFSYSIQNDVDCSYDSLKIYDGSSNHSEIVANLCGYTKYSGMISTTNNLFFVFNSNDFIQREGFQLILSLIGMKINFIINLDQLWESEKKQRVC